MVKKKKKNTQVGINVRVRTAPRSGPEVIKLFLFFMLNSSEREIFPAHKYLNANNCWHFNIYKQENSILGLSEPKKPNFWIFFILMCIFKFHAQLS